MKSVKTACTFRLTCLVFALLLLISVPVSASAEESQPRASIYLQTYSAYVYAVGNGGLQVQFNVISEYDLNEIGVLTIELYESTDNVNFTRVKTFNYETYAQMMGFDTYIHSSYVPYQGVAGRYYKCYVTVWGSLRGRGDSREFWTDSVQAT